ncbi:hypothetical protein [Bacillus dakarensis]|uniref:hypothetical protein n=1 Tax=Robertmurraya dakarensis TaxID=1926278 RepID=UPI0009813DA8|nr:hypothetical protein [Bacillus dakarensis]
MADYNYLLNQYRQLWNNRVLAVEDNSEQTLIDAIKRELLDENSHPRIRKNKHEKFFFAVKRITQSELIEEDKVNLINLHIELLEQLKK